MKHSKSSLFLMELIIALLFFSLASTVCIRLFVKAHSLSAQTVDQNYAVNYAQNMAEAFLGCDGDLQALQALTSTVLPCFSWETVQSCHWSRTATTPNWSAAAFRSPAAPFPPTSGYADWTALMPRSTRSMWICTFPV